MATSEVSAPNRGFTKTQIPLNQRQGFREFVTQQFGAKESEKVLSVISYFSRILDMDAQLPDISVSRVAKAGELVSRDHIVMSEKELSLIEPWLHPPTVIVREAVRGMVRQYLERGRKQQTPARVQGNDGHALLERAVEDGLTELFARYYDVQRRNSGNLEREDENRIAEHVAMSCILHDYIDFSVITQRKDGEAPRFERGSLKIRYFTNAVSAGGVAALVEMLEHDGADGHSNIASAPRTASLLTRALRRIHSPEFDHVGEDLHDIGPLLIGVALLGYDTQLHSLSPDYGKWGTSERVVEQFVRRALDGVISGDSSFLLSGVANFDVKRHVEDQLRSDWKQAHDKKQGIQPRG